VDPDDGAAPQLYELLIFRKEAPKIFRKVKPPPSPPPPARIKRALSPPPPPPPPPPVLVTVLSFTLVFPNYVYGRGFHSSTSHLNLSHFGASTCPLLSST